MLTVRCAACRRTLFRYVKFGSGNLRKCRWDRIVEDSSVRDGEDVRCECGNLIGIDTGRHIRLKGHAFTYSGTTGRP